MNISVPVAYLIQAVSDAVEQIALDTKKKLRVTGIGIDLELTSERTSEGGFSLAFLTIGGTYNRSYTQSLSLQFEESQVASFLEDRVEIDASQLRSLTIAIQVAILNGRQYLAGFALKESVITFNFGVTEEGKIGLGLSGEKPTWGIEFKLAGSTKTTHSMKLTLVQSAPAAEGSSELKS
jgi:hypothetical protein